MTKTIRGLLAGAAAGLITVTAIYFGLFTGGVPVVALALWDFGLRLVPMEVFGFFIVTLKFAAKPLAFWGMLAGLVGAGAVLGAVLERVRGVAGRSVWLGALAGAAVFAGLGVLTAVPAADLLKSRLEATGGSASGALSQVLVALAGYALLFGIAFGVFAMLLSRSTRTTSAGGGGTNLDRMTEVTRREVLRRSFGIAAGALMGSALARWIVASARTTVAYAQGIFERIEGLPPDVTPNNTFYVVSKNPPGFDPTVDGAKWRLEVLGLVGKPVTFTYDAIKQLPSVKQYQTLECISNDVGGDLISNALWRGVRLRDVIERAGGLGPKAFKIAFRCADGYTESLPVVDAMRPDTLLAFEMNGQQLPKAHGFPLRLLVPGLFGMKNPKWITKIEAVEYDFKGYWERSGWSDEAVVQTMSKFTTIDNRTRAKTGDDLGLGGVAYAGDRGIKAVEVSTDDGKTWRPAQLKAPLGKYTWVLWASMWTPSAPGEYTLKVRTIDGGGVIQTSRVQDTLPDGATGYHTLRLRVRG